MRLIFTEKGQTFRKQLAFDDFKEKQMVETSFDRGLLEHSIVQAGNDESSPVMSVIGKDVEQSPVISKMGRRVSGSRELRKDIAGAQSLPHI